jgi:hypothetical protein
MASRALDQRGTVDAGREIRDPPERRRRSNRIAFPIG